MAETPKINVNGTKVVYRPVGETPSNCYKCLNDYHFDSTFKYNQLSFYLKCNNYQKEHVRIFSKLFP